MVAPPFGVTQIVCTQRPENPLGPRPLCNYDELIGLRLLDKCTQLQFTALSFTLWLYRILPREWIYWNTATVSGMHIVFQQLYIHTVWREPFLGENSLVKCIAVVFQDISLPTNSAEKKLSPTAYKLRKFTKLHLSTISPMRQRSSPLKLHQS